MGKRTCECGVCPKCSHREYMNGYYRRNAEKIRDRVKAHREENINRVRERDRQRGYREYDALKAQARRKVNHEIAAGRLERQPCEVCGEKAHAHHEDHRQPLEIIWLCPAHHGQRHRVI